MLCGTALIGWVRRQKLSSYSDKGLVGGEKSIDESPREAALIFNSSVEKSQNVWNQHLKKLKPWSTLNR